MTFQFGNDSVSADRLAPPSRTLLSVGSDDINNAAWSKINVTVTTGRPGPDGIASAEGIFETVDNAAHELSQDCIGTLVSGTLYLQEAIVKPIGTGRYLKLQSYASAFASGIIVYYDLTNMRVGSATGYGSDLSIRDTEIVPLWNGYIICRVYFLANSNNAVDWNYWTFFPSLEGSGGYVGDTSKGFDFYRAALYTVP
jgi:hypothetical protein